jgi:hypothetical protein
MGLEQPEHLVGGLEVALGVGLQPQPGLGDRGLFADAGQHVLQGAALGLVVKHVVHGRERRSVLPGEFRQAVQAPRVSGGVGPRCGQIGAAAEIARYPGQVRLEGRIQAGGRDHQDQLGLRRNSSRSA